MATKPRFARDERGRPFPSQENIYVALRLLGVELTHDVFADRSYIKWSGQKRPALLDDTGLTELWLTIDLQYHFRPKKEFFSDVILNLARGNGFHPVLGYLADVQKKWDGKPRIDTWLSRYTGAEDTAFNRAVGALWSIGAVRRVRQPGCKFDELPVLESPQGGLKSSMLAVLAVKPEWFTDCVPINADPKVVIEQTRGRWIIEIAELSGMRKGEVEGIKAFLSRGTDSARASYGRLTEHVPRQFICAGTTNAECYLKDLTGNRRFWSVKLGNIDLDALKRDRDQLWAEAAVREAKGESIRLAPELWGEAAKVQRARQEGNQYLDVLSKALGDRTCGKIAKADVYRLLDLKTGQIHQGVQELIGDAMKTLGWRAATGILIGGSAVRAFVKGDEAHAREEISIRWSDSERRFVVEDDVALAKPHTAFSADVVAARAGADHGGGSTPELLN